MAVEKEILQRYLKGTTSPEEDELVAEWLKSKANEQDALDWLKEAWDHETGSSAQLPSFDTVFTAALERENNQAKLVQIGKRKKTIWAVAAACLFFLIAGASIGYFVKNEIRNGSMPEIRTAHTGKGERSQIVLSNGSEIFLNGETTVMISRERNVIPEVFLEGEAFFDMKNENQSVIIRTRDIVTTAKGSRFNISAFPSDSTVKVSVREGKAEVKSNTETYPLLKLRLIKKDSAQTESKEEKKIMPLMKIRPVIVREKEHMTFDKKNQSTSIATDSTDGLNWKDGILKFDNAEMDEVADKLERWFGHEVNFSEATRKSPPFTGSFQYASVEKILTAIAEATGIQYRISGNIIYLTKVERIP